MGLLWAGEVEETSGRDAEAVNKIAMSSPSLRGFAPEETEITERGSRRILPMKLDSLRNSED